MNEWLNNTTDKYTIIDFGINASKVGTIINNVVTDSVTDSFVTQNSLNVIQSLIYAGIEKYDGENELSWLFIKDAASHAGQIVTIDVALKTAAYLVGSTTVSVAIAGYTIYDAYQYYYTDNNETNSVDINNKLFHYYNSEIVDVM